MVWVGMATAVGLGFAVQRMQRDVNCGGREAHGFRCFVGIARRHDLCSPLSNFS